MPADLTAPILLPGPFDPAEIETDIIARRRSRIGLGIALLFGISAATIAVTVSSLATRYMGASLAALAGIVGLPLLGSRQRARDVVVMALCVGLSVGFSISFLLRLMVPNKFVPFMGAAEGVTVSLTFVATAFYYAIWWFERHFYAAIRHLHLYQPLFWPSVVFMATGLLTLANAVDFPLVFLEEFRLLCLLGVTVAVMNLTPRELNVFLLTLGGSVMVQAALAATEFVTGRSLGLSIFGEAAPILAGVDFEAVPRPTGLFGDPNIMAYFFEINAPLMLALMYVARNKLERLFFLAATAAGLAGILVSLSRAAWITVPITFGIVTLVIHGRRLMNLRAALVGIAGLSAIATAMVYVWPIIRARLLGDDAGSMSQRLPLDWAALAVWQKFPLVGVGMNNFAVTFTDYDTTGAAWVRPEVDYVVHNLFLLVGTETGGIGFAAFLWYFGSVWLTTLILFRSSSPHPNDTAPTRRPGPPETAPVSWQALRPPNNGRVPAPRVMAGPAPATHDFSLQTDQVLRSGAPIRTKAIALGISAGLLAHLMHGMVDPGFWVNLTISELIAAQIGVVGNLSLAARRRVPPLVKGSTA